MGEFDIRESINEDSERLIFILYALHELEEITQNEVEEYTNKSNEMDEQEVENLSKELIEKSENPNKISNMVNYTMWRVGAFSSDYKNQSGKIRYRIDDIKLVKEYEDYLKDKLDEIKSCLEDNLHRSDNDSSYETILSTLSGIIHEIGEQPIRRLIVKSIFNLAEEETEILNESLEICTIDEDIEDFIQDIHIKYQAELQWAKAYDQQGNKFIKNHAMDLALRNHNKSPGINHTFNINQEGNIDITTNLNQSLELIVAILDAEIESIEEFGSSAKRNITPELLGNISDRFETLVEKYEEESDEKIGDQNPNDMI